MDAALKIDENKVPGCLSTVHIHARREDDKIYYLGDSDAQMTKGLVAMLVNGLSGHTNAQIQQVWNRVRSRSLIPTSLRIHPTTLSHDNTPYSQVQPDFINYAGIGSTMTPGRNNGFLNMMKVMKDKAQALVSEDSTSGSGSGSGSLAGSRPIYQAIVMKLSMLKPSELVVEDESHKHAGHAGGSVILLLHLTTAIYLTTAISFEPYFI